METEKLPLNLLRTPLSCSFTMKSVLEKRLLRRELGDNTPYSSIAGIYGDKTWIDDMDIVNELGGHTGCVNALRYSTPF